MSLLLCAGTRRFPVVGQQVKVKPSQCVVVRGAVGLLTLSLSLTEQDENENEDNNKRRQSDRDHNHNHQ